MLSSEQLIGQPISALTFKEDVQQELDLFARLHETKQPFEADKRITQSDAKIIWVRQSVSPILDPEGNLESTIGVWIDITEQKEIDRHKDEFISIASHELKTPLTSLHAYGEILEEKLRRGDQVDILSLVKKLNHQIQRFKKLIMQLLDTGKITAGNLVISKARFNLTKVISDLICNWQITMPSFR